MEWIAAHWWQVALVVLGYLAVRELTAISRTLSSVERMMGALRDVRGEAQRQEAMAEQYGTNQPETVSRP